MNLSVSIRHVVTIYKHRGIGSYYNQIENKNLNYIVEQIDTDHITFEVINESLESAIKYLYEIESTYLQSLTPYAYYPEFHLSILTYDSTNNIGEHHNGYYQIEIQTLSTNQRRIIKWFELLFKQLWLDFKYVDNLIYIGHCPLNILDDILHIISCLCQHGLSHPIADVNDFWFYLDSKIQHYSTYLQINDMTTFMNYISLSPDSNLLPLSVNDFLKYILCKLFKNFTHLPIPTIWNIHRRYMHYLIESFEIDPLTHQFRGYLLSLLKLILNYYPISISTLYQWMSDHYPSYHQRFYDIIYYLLHKQYIIVNSNLILPTPSLSTLLL